MYFEIAAVAAVIVFAILAYYIIQTLLRLQKTLKHIDLLTMDLNVKARSLDSTVNALSNIGDICENKAALFRSELLKQQETEPLPKSDYTDDLVDLIYAGLKLGSTYITRRK